MMMTSLAVLGILAAGIKPLRNGFYVLHMLVVLLGVWVVQRAIGDAPLFSHKAGMVFLLLHLLSINLLTYLAYAVDKRAAKRGKWRVPERQLQALAMIGGTPGGWLGQKILRHKLRKKSFNNTFWAIVLVQVLLLIWMTL